MRRKTINFVIIVLFTFFSVSLVYAETDYSKSIWNNNVAIGYELDHFSPTKIDSVNINVEKGFIVRRVDKQLKELHSYIEKGKQNEVNVGEILVLSFIASLGIYVCWAIGTFVCLIFIGILLLISVKLLRDIINNS